MRATLLALAATSIAAGMLVPVLPLFLLGRGFTFLQLGSAMGLVGAGAFIAHGLAARHPRALGHPVMIVGLLALASAAYPLYLFVDTPLKFIAVSAVATFFSAAAQPAIQRRMALAADGPERSVVFSYYGVLLSLSYATGVVTGGLLMTRSFAHVFVAASFCSFVSLGIMVAFLVAARERSRGLDSAVRASSERIQEQVRGLRERTIAAVPVPALAIRNLRFAGIHAMLLSAAMAAYPVYLPRHLIDLGLPLGWVGAVVAASWLTFAVAQPIGGAWGYRYGNLRTIAIASLLCVAALNLVVSWAALAFVVVAWILLGLADGIGRPVATALVAAHVPPGEYGRAFGHMGAASILGRFLGPLLMAVAIMTWGLREALMVASLLVTLSAVSLLLVRRLGAASPAPRAQEEVTS